MTPSVPDPAALVGSACTGDRRAIGRLLTLVERGGEQADEVTELTHGFARGAHVVGITGSPGSGKSTLTGQLIRIATDHGRRPAVLAVDPSSPLSGGAILGDRIRMDGPAAGRAFIRSMATRGHQGGLALAVPAAIRVFDACGFDPVIVETVGVGQVEVDVAGTADTTVVVVTPGMGDAVQANKAGLLEVADIFVVNKADRSGATDTRRDLEQMLDLSHITGREDPSGRRPEIVMTVATDATGCRDLWQAIAAHLEHLVAEDSLAGRRADRVRQEVRDRAEGLLLAALDDQLEHGTTRRQVESAVEGERSPTDVARAVVAELLDLTARRRINP